MGGVDKGLQPFHGKALAQHSLERLQPQVGALLLNANRNAAAYAALCGPFAAPVLPDVLPDYPGPLAGFLTGLAHCQTPYLLTVPCDTPLFPLDLAARLLAALKAAQASIAMVSAPESDAHNDAKGDAWRGAGPAGPLRPQPVFCLLRAELLASLRAFTEGGGRKIDTWTAQHPTVLVPFDAPGDDPRAFSNANTLAELQALQNP